MSEVPFPNAPSRESVAPPPFGAAPAGQPSGLVTITDGPPPVMLSAAEPEWELAPPITAPALAESIQDDPAADPELVASAPAPVVAPLAPAPPLPPAATDASVQQPVDLEPAPAEPAPTEPVASEPAATPAHAFAPVAEAPDVPAITPDDAYCPLNPPPSPDLLVEPVGYEVLEGVRHPRQILEQLARAEAAAHRMQQHLAGQEAA